PVAGGISSAVCYLHDLGAPRSYSLSLPDALPICPGLSRLHRRGAADAPLAGCVAVAVEEGGAGVLRAAFFDGHSHAASKWCVRGDRKSTRLNSSHRTISYAVFC